MSPDSARAIETTCWAAGRSALIFVRGSIVAVVEAREQRRRLAVHACRGRAARGDAARGARKMLSATVRSSTRSSSW